MKNAIIQIFVNISTFFLGEIIIWVPWFIAKKWFIETTVRVIENKNCPKLVKKYVFSYLSWNNSNIIEFFNVFFFSIKQIYLVIMISIINKIREILTGGGEAKLCLKLIKKHISSFPKFQNYNICQHTLVFS